MSSNARGAIFALLAFAIFSTHDVAIKVLGGTYSPIQIVFFSVLLSFPLATVMLMRDSTAGTLIPKHPWWLALRTGAAVLTGVSAFYAFSVLPLAETYAIIFASPLIITILAIPVLGEKVRLRRWMAVVVGLIGVVIVLRPGTSELTLGHAAALAAALGGAVAAIVVRKIGAEERPVVMLLYPMVVNFVLMAALLPLVYEPMYSQIIWASLYGTLFFDERMSVNTMIGAGIIIASGLYIVLRESSGGSVNTPVLRTRSRGETGTTPRMSLLMRAAGKIPPRS